jgi:hypothetical protein
VTVSKDEAPPVLTGLSFETPAAQAPQDERDCETLQIAVSLREEFLLTG